MKQYQMTYSGNEDLTGWLTSLQNTHPGSDSPLFYLCSYTVDYSGLYPVLDAIKKVFPKALYAGSSGSGSITSGTYNADSIAIAATFFEYSDTKIRILQAPLTTETQKETAAYLLHEVETLGWVKAVEMMGTIGNCDIPQFCRDISLLPENIEFFGGGALATDTHDGTSSDTYVLSSSGEIASYSAVFILYGGDHLHVKAGKVTGWRRLGLPFEVTSVEGNIVHELDHKPAFEVYQKYLNIPSEEYFFDMAVVFPFAFDSRDGECMRVSMYHLSDGSLGLASVIDEGVKGNIAYGDPAYIIESVKASVERVKEFSPQALRLYSCSSRQFYWQNEIDVETTPFQEAASTSGFYTSGEFLRQDGKVILHNVTLVVGALREGEAEHSMELTVPEIEPGFSRQIMINHCLTTFINTATEQLIEANQKLSHMAITDSLTGLLNRGEIERQIRNAMESTDETAPVILMMIDLDDFKMVNDTYGHEEGDEVLVVLSDIFTECIKDSGLSAYTGRWGGEEFMILLPGADHESAHRLAEKIRTTYAEHHFPVSGTHTLSASITESRPEDNADRICSRVDNGLYNAKKNGKNQTVEI
ncbi:MAG: GGDEF domain-containing protein [Solobacterium sp.]|nr:GGDEF domain-containing protein [Solobacterium sp.]